MALEGEQHHEVSETSLACGAGLGSLQQVEDPVPR